MTTTKKTQVTPDVMKVENGRLIIDVALDSPTPSASGKTKVYKSTRGNVAIEGGFTLGLNLYRKV